MNNLIHINQDLMTIKGDFTQKFLDQYKSSGTQRVYRQTILEFFKVESTSQIKLSMLQNIYSIQIQEYIDSISHLGHKSIKRKISTLSSLLDYINYLGRACNIQVDNIFKDRYFKKSLVNKIEKEEDEAIDIFTLDEINKLFSLPYPIKRDYVILKFLFNTGARLDEVVKLMPNDIYKIGKEWAVRLNGKGRKQRVVYIRQELVDLLSEITFSPNTPIFNCSGSNIYKLLNKYCRKANIVKQRISPHIARHTFTSLARQNGATLEELQETLGHKSIETTRHYVHLIDKFNQSATRNVNV